MSIHGMTISSSSSHVVWKFVIGIHIIICGKGVMGVHSDLVQSSANVKSLSFIAVFCKKNYKSLVRLADEMCHFKLSFMCIVQGHISIVWKYSRYFTMSNLKWRKFSSMSELRPSMCIRLYQVWIYRGKCLNLEYIERVLWMRLSKY